MFRICCRLLLHGRFYFKMARKKVTETGVELHCAQLAQKCLFVIRLVSLLSVNL
jgi:hypothetical protein